MKQRDSKQNLDEGKKPPNPPAKRIDSEKKSDKGKKDNKSEK
jgi:hypothetical protein